MNGFMLYFTFLRVVKNKFELHVYYVLNLSLISPYLQELYDV